MDFTDRLQALTHQVSQQPDGISSNETTRNAYVLPFIQALGYDISDQSEVCPRFAASGSNVKDGEVDYAIFINAKPALLFACTSCNCNLNEADTAQLRRSFQNASASIGILTNGKSYYIYTDFDEQNIMDEKPLLHVDLFNLDEQIISALTMLSKGSFDHTLFLITAGELKYIQKIKNKLLEETSTPSLQMVGFFADQVYSRHKTQQTLSQFAPIVKKAFNQFIDDRVNDRLKPVKDGQTVGVFENIQRANNRIGRAASHDIFISPEEFEGFFVVNIT